MPFIPRITILDSMTKTYANLEMKDYVKYLGLMIDSNLSWKFHIESICHKISKSTGIIAKVHLINCPLLKLWYLCLGKLCLDISKKDHNFTKNGPYVLFTSVSLRNTTYPSFSNQIAFPYLAYFSEIVAIYCMISTDRQHQLVYVLNQLVKISQIHNYRTRSVSSDSFYVKFSRTDKMYDFFSRIGAQIWNSIPYSIKLLKRSSFRKKIKELLLHFFAVRRRLCRSLPSY